MGLGRMDALSGFGGYGHSSRERSPNEAYGHGEFSVGGEQFCQSARPDRVCITSMKFKDKAQVVICKTAGT